MSSFVHDSHALSILLGRLACLIFICKLGWHFWCFSFVRLCHCTSDRKLDVFFVHEFWNQTNVIHSLEKFAIFMAILFSGCVSFLATTILSSAEVMQVSIWPVTIPPGTPGLLHRNVCPAPGLLHNRKCPGAGPINLRCPWGRAFASTWRLLI